MPMSYHWALQWAPNIKLFQLSDSNIGSGFWKIIGGLSKLKALEMSSVSFQGDIPVEEIDHVAGLRVSSLEILDSQVFSLFQVLNPTILSKLDCDPESLDTLLAGGSIDSLEVLTIADQGGPGIASPDSTSEHSEISVRSLKAILSKVPSLLDLTIYPEFIIEDPGITPQDFSVLLPNLRSLACWFPHLAFLVLGRPLVSLQVLDGGDNPPLDLGAIPSLGSHGSMDITELCITSAISLTPGHFPRLRKLVLDFPLDDDDELETPGPEVAAKLTTLITDTYNKWAVNPSVQQLHITICAEFPLLDLALQHTMLSGILLQKFPALRQFQLGDHVEWEWSAVDKAWQTIHDDAVNLEPTFNDGIDDIEEAPTPVSESDGKMFLAFAINDPETNVIDVLVHD
ncbi:hypothetical protein BD779DRAFT_1667130 [Infundibulicybe gibba]|nr:hypothetical protein BD779DRAFT_1667130 [Infundibulicybe gibba]